MKVKPTSWDYFYFIVTLIMYFMGVGIARYYGSEISSLPMLFGVIWIFSILIAEKFMEILFRKKTLKGDEIRVDEDEKTRQFNLILLTSFLILSAIIVVAIKLVITFSFPIILIIVLSYLLVAGNYLEPVELRKKGFYELGISLFRFGLVPALGFFTVAPKYNQALFIFCFPLFLIALAHHLVMGLFTFSQDLAQNKRSLIININWRNGILLHTIIIIISYLFIFSSYWLGISAKVLFPALLTFPIALFQVFWVLGIGQGKRPQWPLITTISAATLISTAYLLAYSLWVN